MGDLFKLLWIGIDTEIKLFNRNQQYSDCINFIFCTSGNHVYLLLVFTLQKKISKKII